MHNYSSNILTFFCFLYVYEVTRRTRSVLFHWDQRGDIATAYRACLLCFHELLSAVIAHTEVTAGHNESVFFLRETDQALGIRAFVFYGVCTIRSDILTRHTVDGLDFKGQSIDLVQFS